MIPESVGSIDPSKLNNLREKSNEYQKQLKLLKDIKSRLAIQSMIGKLVVAEGIKDFHEQMEILLDKKVKVDAIGPELLGINREGLNMTLNLSELKQTTPEEWGEMEQVLTAKISAKMSNLTSPQNRVTPKSNRTIHLPRSDSNEKL